MIEKQEFYYGAALARLVEDERCDSVKRSSGGYLVNGLHYVLIKYSTKGRSPWGFSFSTDDLNRLRDGCDAYQKCFIAMVCGGDGICSVMIQDVIGLLNNRPGWISVKRSNNEAYGVSGPEGSLRHKVPMNRWPAVLFHIEESK
jgi:hypothetical protein